MLTSRLSAKVDTARRGMQETIVVPFFFSCSAVSVFTTSSAGWGVAQTKTATKLGDLSGSGTIFDSLPPLRNVKDVSQS